MQVIFLPMNKKIEAEQGACLLELARTLNIDLNSICAGNGTCLKCKVIISKGNNEVTQLERKKLTKNEIEAGIRLACCFRVSKNTCVIVNSALNEITGTTEKGRKDGERFENMEIETGIVFDIGTTSVEAALYDIRRKKPLTSVVRSNPQRMIGADIISRITYANRKKENFEELHLLIIDCCNDIVKEMIEKCRIQDYQIKKAVAVGNTIMISFLSNNYENGNILRLERIPQTPVFLPECIGGYVGSDTLGCILETEVHRKKGIYIIADVGTNGEIVLSKNGEMTVCSTAAGPAFEGASISKGMRAQAGAIYEVRSEENTTEVKVIGGGKPLGICGSGLIDAAAVFWGNGTIDETGYLREPVVLTDGVHDGRVDITQQDIRELQLAKAAIYTGISLALKEERIDMKEVDKLYLAGNFGNHINVSNAIRIGLLPAIDTNKIECIGNAALKGAAKILTGIISPEAADETLKYVKHLELANHPQFEAEFIRAINFKRV